MKNLHLIFAALVLLGMIGSISPVNSKEVNDFTQVSAAVETAALTELAENDNPETQAQKAFLETFYNGLDSVGFDDAYIRKYITPKAKKILNDAYDYECDDDCLAVWLFAYEAGGDTGPQLSRSIKEQGDNKFLVNLKYENENYKVLLTVIKEGDTYKIDDIEKK